MLGQQPGPCTRRKPKKLRFFGYDLITAGCPCGHPYMTWMEGLLGVLLLVASGLAVAGQMRYGRLKQKHQALQQRFDRAEQQLLGLWGNKKP